MVEAGQRVSREIAEAVARGWTVLTGTQGAARVLRHDLSALGGATQPRVLTWSAWTAGLWHRSLLSGASDRMLLNRTQEEALWRGLIEQDARVSSLHSPRALARLAAEAWRGLAQHRGLRRLPGSAANEDTETFARLAAAFEAHCRSEGLLPEARLEAVLRQMVLAGSLTLPDTGLLLVGFDRLSPAQTALLGAMRERGAPVETARPEPPTRLAGLMVAEDGAAELRSVAEACRAYLGRHPEARVAVLVPELGADRANAAQIDRTMREVLAPEAEHIASPAGALPYEMSTGIPLAEVPAVADALDLLAWAAGPLALDRVSHLLLSGSLGGDAERRACAEFDGFELRRALLLRPEVTLDWLQGRLARSPRRERLGKVMASLRGMQSVARRAIGSGTSKPWSRWAEIMREVLTAAGWACEPAEDAAVFATRQAWESALDELTTLDFDGSSARFEQALGALRGIAGDTLLRAPTRDAAVQVMAPGESAGLRFDALWFVRAGDGTWPVPAGGNPLLAWPLRRELGMPGSDLAADRAEARRVTERIAGCAPQVVFSYAREVDGQTQRPARVLDGLVLVEDAAATGDERAGALVELETVEDDSRIAPPPDAPIQGGAAVLKAQAACGFRAFAEWRLFATGLDPREPGMNARERGIAVHRVLDRFWEAVETQTALRGMTPEDRDGRLLASVESALADAASEAGTRWEAAYVETQRGRLMALGRRWLALEANRSVPFTVARRESDARDVALGPLRFSLRLDRVDRTEQGAVLIDYKTGKAEPGQWLGERPDEPQLPLYAVLAGEQDLHAIAFATVRAGSKQMELSGFEEGSGTLTKRSRNSPVSLADQVEDWHGVLTQLATDFWSGDTRVSPKEYPGTCKYCEQRLICRLDASSLTSLDEEDDAEGGDAVG